MRELNEKCPIHKEKLINMASILRWQDDRELERRYECPKIVCNFYITIKEHGAPVPKIPKKELEAIKTNLKKCGLLPKRLDINRNNIESKEEKR